MTVEALCVCAHLLSDHETTVEWTVEQATVYGSPCNLCNADPDPARRRADGLYCIGYREWPIDDIPYPGTVRALAVGCKCPVSVNVARAARGERPIYGLECPVHDWVCKRTLACEHDVVAATAMGVMLRHQGQHASCEHCEVPRIACESCGRVWNDWRVRPDQVGWTSTSDLGHRLGRETIWRCSTCQQ